MRLTTKNIWYADAPVHPISVRLVISGVLYYVAVEDDRQQFYSGVETSRLQPYTSFPADVTTFVAGRLHVQWFVHPRGTP